ncbi:MAG: hypothetical protein GX447_06630 [Elusimicrobia bacterium]|nr:hypothetical protein [Elusimicrobiota bacterium]
MKKTYILIAVLASFSAASFAQNTPAPAATPAANAPKAQTQEVKKEVKKIETVIGNITAVNTEKNEITLAVKKDKSEKTFAVDQKEIAKLKAGQEVKLKLVDGKVESIKEMVKHEMKHQKQEKKAEMKKENPGEKK